MDFLLNWKILKETPDSSGVSFWGWILTALIGLVWGSFANVLIHRLPQGLSILKPGSRCPNCRHPIAFYDTLPLLSFLLLKGRCRRCRIHISLRYPCVELLTCLAALFLYFLWKPQWPWILLASFASMILVAIGWIDFKSFLIPDSLSLTFLLTGLLGAYWNPQLQSTPLPWWGMTLLSTLVGFAFAWAMAWMGEKVFRREALGGGDIKLLAGIGAWTGIPGIFHVLLTASALGVVYGTSLILLKRLNRKEPIPFGPFLALGTYIRLCLSP